MAEFEPTKNDFVECMSGSCYIRRAGETSSNGVVISTSELNTLATVFDGKSNVPVKFDIVLVGGGATVSFPMVCEEI